VVFDGRMGTRAEIEVAQEMGCKIIPVPSSDDGFASELLKTESVAKNLSKEYTEKAKTPASLKAEDIFDVLLKSYL
jgi:hypothetical protein